MRSGILALLVISFFAALRATAASDPAIEFTGVLVADGHTKLALTDKASGTTKWIEAGSDFHGYTLGNYDAKTDTLTVKKDGQEFLLPLTSAKAATTSVATTTAVVQPPTPPATNNVVTVLSPTGPTSPASNPASTAPAAPVAPSTPTPTDASPDPANTPVPSVAAQSASAAMMPTQYTVKPGDTFTRISATSGLSVEQLQALNPTVNPAALQPGQSIRTR